MPFGRAVALARVFLPLLLIGLLKFTLAAAPFAPRVGVVGGALGTVTFLSTSSILFALPIWEQKSGGFPFLNDVGTFLIKDVALLGVALVVGAESLRKVAGQNGTLDVARKA